MGKVGRKTYQAPVIERVPLVAEEAVLYNCKCTTPHLTGEYSGWCSGQWGSCDSVGS